MFKQFNTDLKKKFNNSNKINISIYNRSWRCQFSPVCENVHGIRSMHRPMHGGWFFIPRVHVDKKSSLKHVNALLDNTWMRSLSGFLRRFFFNKDFELKLSSKNVMVLNFLTKKFFHSLWFYSILIVTFARRWYLVEKRKKKKY